MRMFDKIKNNTEEHSLSNIDIVKHKNWGMFGLNILQAKYLEPIGSESINLMILFSSAGALLGIDIIVTPKRQAQAESES